MIQKFEFKETEIAGLIEVTPFNADDIRGCFTKDYSKEVFEANGITHDLWEVFYTTSHKGVIRAMHFQRVKQQAKLVRCISGHVYDVVVDLRKDSHTFKKWLGFDLVGDRHNEILVPAGCGHGYLVMEDSIVSYKCG
ncbi:MAG: dTDP-4-dehydrorhamnose 3,5-epimerase family protein, partial [Anaerovorax sp.]